MSSRFYRRKHRFHQLQDNHSSRLSTNRFFTCKKWTEYVEQGGNLVLTCRTGHKNRNGQLWETPFAAPIYDLIGSKIDFMTSPLPETPNHVLFDDIAYAWTSWGEILLPNNGTEVWGTYEDDFYKGSTAITFRRLGKGTVTYVGVDSQEGEMEKKC